MSTYQASEVCWYWYKISRSWSCLYFFLGSNKLLIIPKFQQSLSRMLSSIWLQFSRLDALQKKTLSSWWKCAMWPYKLLVLATVSQRSHLLSAIITSYRRELVPAWLLTPFASSVADCFLLILKWDFAALARPIFTKHYQMYQKNIPVQFYHHHHQKLYGSSWVYRLFDEVEI